VPLSRNLGTLTSCNPLGPTEPVTGLIYVLLQSGTRTFPFISFPLRPHQSCHSALCVCATDMVSTVNKYTSLEAKHHDCHWHSEYLKLTPLPTFFCISPDDNHPVGLNSVRYRSKITTNKMTLMDYPLFQRLVVLHSTCFELQGAHHHEFTFFYCTGSLWHTVYCNM